MVAAVGAEERPAGAGRCAVSKRRGTAPSPLPYHWFPDGASGGRLGERPPVGALVAWRHAAWRVIDVSDVPAEWWTDDDREASKWWGAPYRIVLRPARLGDDPRDRDHDLHLRCPARCEGWNVYRHSHYPVCVECGEPTPCRQQMAEQQAQRAAAAMSRYDTPGVCPACQEPVSARQKSITFADNLEAPAGPPVTFHLRGRCHHSAVRYEERWAKVDPANRRVTLTCRGRLTNHGDGTYECTQGVDCSGPRVNHNSYVTCRDPECWRDGQGTCHPSPGAARRESGDAA